MKNTLETRLGIFFAMAFIAGVIMLEMIGALDLFKSGLIVKAQFNQIQELKLGDPVKMAGVQIGRVDEISFTDNKVQVLMRITDRKAIVRTDSKATIRFAGLMGQNYVALDFGSAKGAPVLNGALLETFEQADLTSLMTKLDGVAGGIKKITDSIGDVNITDLVSLATDFLRENRPRIAAILTNAQAVSEQVVAGKGTVGKLLYDDALYQSALATVTNLNQTAADVRAAIDVAKMVVKDVQAGKGTLGKLTQDEKLYTELTTAATNLKEILQKINQGQGSVGKLVNDESLFKNAKMTLQKLDKATDGLEDQGPISVIGVIGSRLF